VSFASEIMPVRVVRPCPSLCLWRPGLA
jgi:hypothetical protein